MLPTFRELSGIVSSSRSYASLVVLVVAPVDVEVQLLPDDEGEVPTALRFHSWDDVPLPLLKRLDAALGTPPETGSDASETLEQIELPLFPGVEALDDHFKRAGGFVRGSLFQGTDNPKLTLFAFCPPHPEDVNSLAAFLAGAGIVFTREEGDFYSEEQIEEMNRSNIATAKLYTPEGVLYHDGGPVYQFVEGGVTVRRVIHPGEEVPDGAIPVHDLE